MKLGTGVHCRMLITISMFIFPKYFSFMFLGKFGTIIWISSNWLKFCGEVHSHMLITVSMFIFSKFFLFGKFGPKKFFKLTEIWYSDRLLYAYFNFFVYFFKIFVIHTFWENLVAKSAVLQINWNLIERYIAICLLWS